MLLQTSNCTNLEAIGDSDHEMIALRDEPGLDTD